MKAKALTIACLILPLMLLWPGGDNFVYPAGSEYSDLTITHYPNLIFLKKALLETRAVPLWNGTIFSGYPFYVNPLSGMAYPITWLLLLLKQPFGYNLVTSLHLLIGGLGIYAVLRKMGARQLAAILGAVSFELMPKLSAHYAAGHVSLVWAVCLTPWLIFAEEKARGTLKSPWGIVSGVVLGLIALADIRWAPIAGLLFISLRAVNVFGSGNQNTPEPRAAKKHMAKRLAVLGLQIFSVGIVALSVSAIVWLPLLQFSGLSTRAQMTIGERLAFSLPPGQLLGLLFPTVRGDWEWMVYTGAIGGISIAGLAFQRTDARKTRFWLLVSVASLLLALGGNFPPLRLAAYLPGISLLRVPARFLFLFGISCSVLTGVFCDKLLGMDTLRPMSRRAILFTGLLAAALAAVTRSIVGEWKIEFLWGGMAFSIATLFVLVGQHLSGKKYVAIVFVVLYFIMLGDIGLVDRLNRKIVDSREVENEKSALLTWLASQEGFFRVYSPSASIPQLGAAKYGLQLADGIDPLQLSEYANYMELASGVPAEGYGVTIPRFETGNPDTDNFGYLPDAYLLGLLSVKYVCSGFPLNTEGLRWVTTIGDTLIYENEFYLPGTWMQQDDGLFSAKRIPDGEEIVIVEHLPNRMTIQTRGVSGVMVLSEIIYPGWKVKVDGQEGKIISVGGILRGVQIPEGDHEVLLTFEPILGGLGAGITGIAAVTLLFFTVILARRK
jgi:hypothetical protein